MRNRVDAQLVKRFKRYKRLCDVYIHIKFGMLQARKSEISLRTCSGGAAQLHSCATQGGHC